MAPRNQTRKNRKTASKAKQTRKVSLKSKPTTALTKVVKKIIQRNEETKFVIGYPTNFNTSGNMGAFIGFSSAITSTNEVYALIPFTSQGTDDYQRVGNTIQPISLTTKVNLALFTNSSAAIYVDVFFCTSKNIKDYTLTNQVPTGELLNKGDGTNVSYDGRSMAAMYPVNKSEFSVIAHKRIRLSKGADDPNTFCSGGSPASADVFPHYASFSQKIPLPAKLTYESASSTQPSNAFPFIMVGYVPADANGNTAPNGLIQVQAQSHLYYKDA